MAWGAQDVRRGGQKRGIGSETRRLEHRERRVDDVIDAESITRRGDALTEPPQDFISRDIKRRGLGRLCADDDCRRAGGTRAARKGANTRRPSVSDAETGPNAHLEDYSAVSGDERRGRSRDKRVASRERGKRRSATSNEGANGALVLRFFCSRSRQISRIGRSSQAGRTTDIFPPEREILRTFEVGKGQFLFIF